MVEVLYYAIPFFVLLLVVEAMSFRHYHEDDLVGYEVNDTRTSITMGLGNVIVNVAWKAVVVVIYAALYELTPLRCPTATTGGPGSCSSSPTTSPTTGSTGSATSAGSSGPATSSTTRARTSTSRPRCGRRGCR